MTAADLDDVFELGSRSWDATAIPYIYWSRDGARRQLEASPDLCFVADENGRIVGFLLGEASFESDDQTAYLEWLAVAPDHRRQGLGRRLAEAALAGLEERGMGRVMIDIADDNRPSRALAEELGFQEEATVTYFTKRLR